jgi:hypothetical protein
MRVLFFTGIILFSICQTKAQKPVAFPSEYIDFRIDSNYFSINGIYTFRNKTNEIINTNIQFPFAVNTALIDSIRVINLKNLKTINYSEDEKSIFFNLYLSPHDSVQYNIYYRQKSDKKNTYILTTTQSWGAPLENAVYSLTADKRIKIISLSLKPDSSISDQFHTTYFWHKQNFSPQTDFEIIIDK